MNEMYNMSIDTHNISVLIFLGMILINLYKLTTAKEVQPFRKFHMLFNPIAITFMGAIIFTGVVMMAAKHLDFTIPNIVMSVYSVVLIVLEAKRSKAIKYVLNKDTQAFEVYKAFAKKVLIFELAMTMILYIWMVLI